MATDKKDLKALIVDADGARATALTEVLQNCGYVATPAEDAMSAQMLVDSEPFDVALIQEKLGDASGIEVVKGLRGTHAELPIIFMAGSANSPSVAEALNAGASDVFTTPGDYKALFPKLAALQTAPVAAAAAPRGASASNATVQRPAPTASRMAVHPVQLPELQPGSHKDEPNNVDMILDVPVSVNAILGNTTMRISELLQLGPGSVVELDKRAGEPVDLYVNDKLVALGEVVVVNETFGVRITEVIDPRQRISALQ